MTAPRVTYYALLAGGRTREAPSGVVRRTHTNPPVDESFGRDLAWRPTEYLRRYGLGHTDTEHAELTEAEATAVLDRWRAEWAPRLVALYTWGGDGERKRTAEFRWSPAEGVRLTVLDAEWSSFPTGLYENGVGSQRERRLVPRSEGPTFMRTLLQPWRSGYYAFVDETEHETEDGAQ